MSASLQQVFLEHDDHHAARTDVEKVSRNLLLHTWISTMQLCGRTAHDDIWVALEDRPGRSDLG